MTLFVFGSGIFLRCCTTHHMHVVVDDDDDLLQRAVCDAVHHKRATTRNVIHFDDVGASLLVVGCCCCVGWWYVLRHMVHRARLSTKHSQLPPLPVALSRWASCRDHSMLCRTCRLLLVLSWRTTEVHGLGKSTHLSPSW